MKENKLTIFINKPVKEVFEYFEWAKDGELDGLMEMSALELLKELIEKEM